MYNPEYVRRPAVVALNKVDMLRRCIAHDVYIHARHSSSAGRCPSGCGAGAGRSRVPAASTAALAASPSEAAELSAGVVGMLGLGGET